MFFKVDKAAFLKSEQKILAKKNRGFHQNHVHDQLPWNVVIMYGNIFLLKNIHKVHFWLNISNFVVGADCARCMKMQMFRSSLRVEETSDWSVMSEVQVLIFYQS